MSPAPRMPSILLIEPQFVLRRTIVALARDFGLGTLHEVSSIEAAAPLLASKCFDGLVLDLTATAAGFDLLARLRASKFVSDPAIPVIGMTAEPRRWAEPRVQPFDLLRLLDKPFKVGELLNVLQQIARPAARVVA